MEALKKMDEALELGYNVDQTEFKELVNDVETELAVTGIQSVEQGIQSEDISTIFILGTLGGMMITLGVMGAMRQCKKRQQKPAPAPASY